MPGDRTASVHLSQFLDSRAHRRSHHPRQHDSCTLRSQSKRQWCTATSSFFTDEIFETVARGLWRSNTPCFRPKLSTVKSLRFSVAPASAAACPGGRATAPHYCAHTGRRARSESSAVEPTGWGSDRSRRLLSKFSRGPRVEFGGRTHRVSDRRRKVRRTRKSCGYTYPCF